MADCIVGNSPFAGGKDIRSGMGDGYVEALWTAHPKMNDSADFVMYWWDRAATLLTAKGTLLRRFGFVTTNSITQVLQRRVIERYLASTKPVSILMAIADHPWRGLLAGCEVARLFARQHADRHRIECRVSPWRCILSLAYHLGFACRRLAGRWQRSSIFQISLLRSLSIP
jgi:hypothetical protein